MPENALHSFPRTTSARASRPTACANTSAAHSAGARRQNPRHPLQRRQGHHGPVARPGRKHHRSRSPASTASRHFSDPLDIVEDLQTGNLYVAEYAGRQITLLVPKPGAVSKRAFRQSREAVNRAVNQENETLAAKMPSRQDAELRTPRAQQRRRAVIGTLLPLLLSLAARRPGVHSSLPVVISPVFTSPALIQRRWFRRRWFRRRWFRRGGARFGMLARFGGAGSRRRSFRRRLVSEALVSEAPFRRCRPLFLPELFLALRDGGGNGMFAANLVVSPTSLKNASKSSLNTSTRVFRTSPVSLSRRPSVSTMK